MRSSSWRKQALFPRSMSNWASPILVVPKKEECVDTSNNAGSSKNGKFNLWLCINYRKLNNQIQTACQIKADGSLGKVISNYPLSTIDSILACISMSVNPSSQ